MAHNGLKVLPLAPVAPWCMSRILIATSWPHASMEKDAAEIIEKYKGRNSMVTLETQGSWLVMEFGVGMSASQIRIEIRRGGVWTVLTEISVET